MLEVNVIICIFDAKKGCHLNSKMHINEKRRIFAFIYEN